MPAAAHAGQPVDPRPRQLYPAARRCRAPSAAVRAARAHSPQSVHGAAPVAACGRAVCPTSRWVSRGPRRAPCRLYPLGSPAAVADTDEHACVARGGFEHARGSAGLCGRRIASRTDIDHVRRGEDPGGDRCSEGGDPAVRLPSALPLSRAFSEAPGRSLYIPHVCWHALAGARR
jgi:hypothetical protein